MITIFSIVYLLPTILAGMITIDTNKSATDKLTMNAFRLFFKSLLTKVITIIYQKKPLENAILLTLFKKIYQYIAKCSDHGRASVNDYIKDNISWCSIYTLCYIKQVREIPGTCI